MFPFGQARLLPCFSSCGRIPFLHISRSACISGQGQWDAQGNLGLYTTFLWLFFSLARSLGMLVFQWKFKNALSLIPRSLVTPKPAKNVDAKRGMMLFTADLFVTGQPLLPSHTCSSRPFVGECNSKVLRHTLGVFVLVAPLLNNLLGAIH